MDFRLVQYYAFITLLAVLCVLTMSIHVANSTVIEKKLRTWFHISTAIISLCAIANCIGAILDFYHTAQEIHVVVSAFELSVNPFIAMTLCASCGFEDLSERAGIAASINAIFVLGTMPFGLVFYVLPDGYYFRGNFYFVYLVLVAVCVSFLLAAALRMSRMYHFKDVKTLIAILITLAVGIASQTLVPAMKTIYITIAICSMLFYVHNDDLIQHALFEETQKQIEHITNIQERVIVGLAELIDRRDESTGAHVVRTSQYVNILANRAREVGYQPDVLTDEYINTMTECAYLHDVGKITISDILLNKPGKLTDEEFEIMKTHAAQGGDIIEKIMGDVVEPEYLEIAKNVAMYHHEKWDGSGYPEGLAGEDIPLCARIMAVADVYDAVAERRIYKDGITPEMALETISEGAGTHFDPVLAELFVEAEDEVFAVKRD